MAKIKLGINNCFAIKRWAEPEEWIEIIKKELGLNIVQFSFDLLDPNTTEPARTINAAAIKELAQKREIKLSHFISDVLADKVRRSKEDSFVQRVNEIFGDPEVGEEQRLMAKDIADSTDVEELPW